MKHMLRYRSTADYSRVTVSDASKPGWRAVFTFPEVKLTNVGALEAMVKS